MKPRKLSSQKKRKQIKICAIIPARFGSKIVKNKNILKINGKYSFYYSIKASQKSKYIEKLVFSSDSNFYLNLAKNLNQIFYTLDLKKFKGKFYRFGLFKRNI